MNQKVDIFLRPENFVREKGFTINDSQLIHERLDHVARSSLISFNASKFGIKLALAEELRDLGDYPEAEKKAKEVDDYTNSNFMTMVLYNQTLNNAKKAIEIASQAKEPNNIYAAYAEGILGEIFFSEGHYKEAALKFKSALKSYESHYKSSNGPEEVEMIGASQLISWYFMTSKQYDLAAKAIAQELSVIERVTGLNSTDAAEAMLRLGSAHLNNGTLEAAETFFQRALDLYEELYFLHPEPDDEDVTFKHLQALRLVYTGLGNIYYLRGNDSLAEQFYSKVEQSMRFDYFNIAEFAATLQHLAFLKWRAGHVFEAESLLQEVLAALETSDTYGHEDHRTIATRNLLFTLRNSPEYRSSQKCR